MKKCLLLLGNLYLVSITSKFDINSLPWIKAHESDAINFAAPFLPENPAILEAGVCDAHDTLAMKRRWPNAVIYGFEPVPKNYKLSKKNITGTKDVNLYQLALSDKIGTAVFYESIKNSGASSLLKDNLDNIEIPNDIGHDGINYQDKSISVDCITIDAWSEKMGIKSIDYIWLDTEGSELPILKNSRRILSTVKVLSLEANFKEFRKGMTQFYDLYDFLISEGFVLKYIWGRTDWQATAIFINNQFAQDN